MSELMLSQAERDRFAAWLEREARDGDAIAEQMAKLNVPPMLLQKIRAEAMAAKVIAQKLRATERDEVRG